MKKGKFLFWSKKMLNDGYYNLTNCGSAWFPNVPRIVSNRITFIRKRNINPFVDPIIVSRI